MENEFKIPSNISVIDKPEDYHFIIGVTLPKNEELIIPDNIQVYDKPEDSFQIPSNIQVIEKEENNIKEEISNEELDIWEQIKEEFDTTNWVIQDKNRPEDDGVSFKIDKDNLFTWLKEKLSGVSFCQTYLNDKVDGDNGIVKENSTLMLESEKGSKFFLNKAGKYHRLDGPAIEWNYGAKEYFKNGIRHRIGGPAYENKDENQFWFEGKQYSETEYWIISKEIENLK